MFNSIRGRLSEKRADSICVETGGVEWLLSVPARSVDEFGATGEEVRAYTWLHHYEDGMRLYAFPRSEDREVFLELTKVEGIGPKQALKILSGIRTEELASALEADDLAALERIPGVGRKTAQKMLLALKGKLHVAEEGPAPGKAKGEHEFSDVVRALADMGFDRKRADEAVKRAALDHPEGSEREREVFRRALVELSAGA
ncbi:MAG TPA: Holliday junction branch migration protein RuvA [Rectinemataceae bacterium]|nr:Holliday junction branch migration protein RuvA [Rectinemataceae bacterium]